MTAKEKFRKGDRVRQGATCPRSYYRIQSGSFREGVVAGFSFQPQLVRVSWDGDRPSSVQSYHMDFVDKITTEV